MRGFTRAFDFLPFVDQETRSRPVGNACRDAPSPTSDLIKWFRGNSDRHVHFGLRESSLAPLVGGCGGKFRASLSWQALFQAESGSNSAATARTKRAPTGQRREGRSQDQQWDEIQGVKKSLFAVHEVKGGMAQQRQPEGDSETSVAPSHAERAGPSG